jgi:membrane protein implicated in regulation of membrane protease activity
MGSILLISGIIGIIVYGWLVFLYNPQLTLQITAFATVTALLVIIIWIGYTMATTPSPTENIEIEEIQAPEAKDLASPKSEITKPEEKTSEKKAKK